MLMFFCSRSLAVKDNSSSSRSITVCSRARANVFRTFVNLPSQLSDLFNAAVGKGKFNAFDIQQRLVLFAEARLGLA